MGPEVVLELALEFSLALVSEMSCFYFILLEIVSALSPLWVPPSLTQSHQVGILCIHCSLKTLRCISQYIWLVFICVDFCGFNHLCANHVGQIESGQSNPGVKRYFECCLWERYFLLISLNIKKPAFQWVSWSWQENCHVATFLVHRNSTVACWSPKW